MRVRLLGLLSIAWLLFACGDDDDVRADATPDGSRPDASDGARDGMPDARPDGTPSDDAGVDTPNADAGCLEPKLCFESPLPHGGTIQSVWPDGPEDAWGSVLGAVVHFDGARTSLYPSGAPLAGFEALYGPTPSVLYSASLLGVARRVDGGDWSAPQPIMSVGPRTIHGTAADDIWVGGEGGIAHFDGSAWTMSHAVMAPESITALFARSTDDVWAASSLGTVLRFDGETWREIDAPGTDPVTGMWAASADETWLTTSGGTVLHDTGTGFEIEARIRAQTVWGRAGERDAVWFTAYGAPTVQLWRFDGSDFDMVANPRGVYFSSLRGNGAEVWAGGDGGTLARLTDAGVEHNHDDDTTSSAISDLAIGGDPLDLWGVTFDRVLVHREEVDGAPRWRIAGTGADTFTGDRLFVRVTSEPWQWTDRSLYRFDTASSMMVPASSEVPSTATLESACALEDGSVLAAVSRGSSGHEVWFAEAQPSGGVGSFIPEHVETLPMSGLSGRRLIDVFCGEGSRAWVTGSGSDELWERSFDAVDGGSWTRVGFPSGATVEAFAASQTDAWALATASTTEGTIRALLHFDGAQWSWDRSIANLDAARHLVGASDSDVWMIGTGGMAAHWNGTDWTERDAPGAGDLVTAVIEGGVLYALDAAGDRHTFDGSWTATMTTKPAGFDASLSFIRSSLAVGSGANEYRLDGNTWTETTFTNPIPIEITRVVPDGTGALVVANGSLYAFDATTGFAPQPALPSGAGEVVGVVRMSPTDVRVVTEDGGLFQRGASSWTEIDRFEGETLFFVQIAASNTGLAATYPTHSYIDGGSSRASIATLRAPVSLTRGADGEWRAGERDGRVVIVDDDGTADVIAPPLDRSLTDRQIVFAIADDAIYRCERIGGRLERRVGGAFEEVVSPSIYMGGDQVVAPDGRIWFAGGTGGQILRLDP